MRPAVKAALKWLRASQPFNWIATSAVRAALRATHVHSELVVRHLHRMGTVRARLPNGRTMRLWSKADDWISNQVFWRGWSGYEPETTPLFFELARTARVTIDVGAFVGYYAILAAHANSAGCIFAFEPLPSVAARLRKNVEINQLGNVRCISSAAAATDGMVQFYHVPRGLPTSSSFAQAFMSNVPGVIQTTVPAVRLDRFVEEQQLVAVDLVKIDTETTEPAVLAGMVQTVRRHRPHIVCEVLASADTGEPIEALLGPCGYRFYHLSPDGPVVRDRIRGDPQSFNYLFTPWAPEQVDAAWQRCARS